MRKYLKKILTWLQTTPPKYKLVIAFWEDIQSSCTWESIETIKSYQPAICWSIGYLIEKNEDNTIICSDLNVEEKNGILSIEEGGNTTTIPTKNVLKLHEIPLNYKF